MSTPITPLVESQQTKTKAPSPTPPTLTVFDGVTNALLLSSIGFLLGALFVALTTEYGLLYTNAPTTADAYLAVEQAYLTLWTSPLAVRAIFHLLLLLPIFTLSVKVSRYTEAAIYFDGLCLAMMLLVLGLYTGSTVPNLRKLAFAPSNQALLDLVNNSPNLKIPTGFDPLSPASIINGILVLLSHPASILLKPHKALENEQEFKKALELNPIDEKSRHELLSVTAAGHSIAIFLLIGIIILQIGKVYAEVEDANLKAKFELEESQRVAQDRKDQ
ncbi:ER membrane protein SH3 [Puccinia triticina 1-1 BBBD Race 1]|uniref:ER membrane protein SH3 n=2 Tax=Puccinia triticina TaxID=208348 RepID=A0A0C4EYR1_PUCT1|nr:uncharacterized protein PtA15_9A142 [Puccinia triticina]OAW00125.1 ER membrane protein SH3 [Puccinia triticina 1-1 BBBD Race 1]WAQ88017.1 hypothetical protein PtA15_9A142 [Puccinia triticina]WAR60214.1 hypothetical protein PtB15_9B151 [Puccinia triticina]